jgi:hypothetical protein
MNEWVRPYRGAFAAERIAASGAIRWGRSLLAVFHSKAIPASQCPPRTNLMRRDDRYRPGSDLGLSYDGREDPHKSGTMGVSHIDASDVLSTPKPSQNTARGRAAHPGEDRVRRNPDEREGHPIPVVHGVVTTGTEWLFFQLEGQAVTFDIRERFLDDVARILGYLTAIGQVGQGKG